MNGMSTVIGNSIRNLAADWINNDHPGPDANDKNSVKLSDPPRGSGDDASNSARSTI